MIDDNKEDEQPRQPHQDIVQVILFFSTYNF